MPDTHNHFNYLSGEQGNIQSIPLIIVGVLAVFTLFVANQAIKNTQDFRGRAAVYPSSSPTCIPFNSSCGSANTNCCSPGICSPFSGGYYCITPQATPKATPQVSPKASPRTSPPAASPQTRFACLNTGQCVARTDGTGFFSSYNTCMLNCANPTPLPKSTPKASPQPSPWTSPQTYACALNGNYCVLKGEGCLPGEQEGAGGTCATGKVCCKRNPQVSPNTCIPNSTRCVSGDQSLIETCSPDGTRIKREACPLNQNCVSVGGSGSCQPKSCNIGDSRCNGGNVESCDYGNWQLWEKCTGGCFINSLGNYECRYGNRCESDLSGRCVPDDFTCTPDQSYGLRDCKLGYKCVKERNVCLSPRDVVLQTDCVKKGKGGICWKNLDISCAGDELSNYSTDKYFCCVKPSYCVLNAPVSPSPSLTGVNCESKEGRCVESSKVCDPPFSYGPQDCGTGKKCVKERARCDFPVCGQGLSCGGDPELIASGAIACRAPDNLSYVFNCCPRNYTIDGT
ncbi:MAG: hypothetical protein AAB874_07750, partial [Patescibacteria group bacterium]